MSDIAFPILETTSPADGAQLLRSVLRENALFSATSGAILAAGAPKLDTWLGLNAWILVALGVGLVAYAVALWKGTNDNATLRLTGRTAVAGDAGWIVGAFAIIAGTSWLTDNGEIVLAIVSLPVALFLVGQAVGLRRM